MIKVTSSMRSRRIRFRSRGSTEGSFQTRGKSSANESSCARLRINQQALLLRLLLILLLRLGERTKFVVPFRFQALGDQAIVGIDLHVAAAGEFSLILCTLNMYSPQRIDFGNPGLHFLLNGQRHL